jgi:Tol biopolymer transport system component
VAQPLTAEGTIIGTFQYMAPEQLEGKETDARSDVWAFGCVLYEMATGKRAFDGKSQASLITSIMGSEPAPISAISAMSPPALDRLVTAMIAKDPADRVQSAHDVKLQLQWIAEGGSTAGMPAVPSRRAKNVSWLPWVVAAVAILAAGFFALRGKGTSGSEHPVHASISPPAGVMYSSTTDRPLPLAISHDGKLIAFCARNGEGPDMLWIRSVDTNDAHPVAGTEGAEGPFFSPDARSIGFFTRGTLKRVDAAGGAVITLVDKVDARGGTWSKDGIILYGNGTDEPLWQVREDGGKTNSPVTVLDSTRAETTHRYPFFLPDGKHFLYLARQSGAGGGKAPIVFAGELGSKSRTSVLEVASNVQYASGYILYIRGNVLVAQRFDPDRLAVSGPAMPLVDNARMDERFSRGVFAVSDNGVLVCMTGTNQTRTQLEWLDRKGVALGSVGEPADYTYGGTPELSDDDSQAVMAIANRDRGTSDIWIIDLASGRRRRLTVDADDHPAAIFGPHGTLIVATLHGAVNANRYSINLISQEGVIQRMLRRDTAYTWPRALSPDGRVFLCDGSQNGEDRSDITMSALDDSTKTTFIRGEDTQTVPQFSPDGHCVAYSSDESGRPEIYVAAYPSGGRWQVSQDGGTQPRWRADGHELFYQDNNNYMVAVNVTRTAGAFESGSSQKLFQFHGMRSGGWCYDVSRDGSKFLVTRPLAEDLALPITIITDWTRKVAAK